MPRRALTTASVERIKRPDSGQVDHFDKGFPGLALRASYGGGKSWGFFYRIGRRLRRMTLGTHPAMSLAEAREAWREGRQNVASGRDPAQARKRDKPASDFATVSREWLKRDQAKKRSRDEVRRILDKDVIPAWGYRQVSDIGRRDVLDLIDSIADRGAVIMARRVHAHLHRFFKWCVGRGILESNPMANLPKPGSEAKRDRVLSDAELILMWRVAEMTGWPFGPAFQLLLLTGARRDEIGALRWSEIDDVEINLRGERTKSGEPHTIPLSSSARAIISNLPRIANSQFVFSTTGRTPISGWSRAKRMLDEKMA